MTVQKENDVFKRKSREASKTMSIILYTFLKSFIEHIDELFNENDFIMYRINVHVRI